MSQGHRLDRRRFLVTTGAAGLALGVPMPSSTAGTLGSGRHRPRLDPVAFRDPASRYRPQLYWWWPGGAVAGTELRREVAEMAAAGFGGATMTWLDLGVIDPEDPTVAAWGTAPWRARVADALTAARDHDMRLDLTSASAWAFNSPATTPTNGLSSRELVYGSYDVAGPTRLDIEPPAPGESDATLIAVTAARAVEPEGTEKPRLLATESVIDLTDRIASDGRVRWDVPAGTWIVFGHWHRATSQRPWQGADTAAEPSYVIDHFERRSVLAAASYLDRHVLAGPVRPQLPAGAGSIYLDSLEIDAEGVFWTPDFLTEFERRRGYSLEPYLPAVLFIPFQSFRAGEPSGVPDFELTGGAGERVRHDYSRTLTDLYIEEQLEPLTAWARSRGLSVRGQPAYGTTLDPIRSASALPRLETETLAHLQPATVGSPEFGYGMDAYRMTTSGAHIGAADEIGLELGAVFLADYALTLADVKAMIDQAYACGINQAVLHGYPYRDAPGATWPSWHPFSTELLPFGFSEIWTGVQPQWRHIRGLADYIARNNLALRLGEPRVDLAVYYDGFLLRPYNSAIFPASDVEALGFAYGFVDPVSLGERRDSYRSRRLFPRSPAYRALVINDEPAMPADTAGRILSYARRGLPVAIVGDLPQRGTSWRRAADDDRRVRKAVDALLGEPTVRHVASISDLPDALRSLRVEPRVRFAQPVPVRTAQREMAHGSVFYLWNPGPDAVDTTASLEATGRPLVLDAWSGAIRSLAEHTKRGGRIEVPVRLQAGETMLIGVNRDSPTEVEPAAVRTRLADVPAMRIDRWQLSVEDVGPDGSQTHRLVLDQLRDWREIPLLQEAAGVGTYRASISLDRRWRRATGARLDLGTVHGSVRVRVNGKLITPRVVADAPFEIDGRLLGDGRLTIEVEVATVLRNRLLQLAHSGHPEYARFLAREASGSGSQPVGLVGPVRLVPLAPTQSE